MNFKNMYAYNLYENKKSLTIFYGVIIGIYLMVMTTHLLFDADSSIGGMEMSSIIFLFIVGLNSFKSNFHFGLTNGVSRKTQFRSAAAAVVTVAVIMAVLDIVISSIAKIFIPSSTLYLTLYEARYSNLTQLSFMNHVQIIVEQLLWSAALYSMAGMLGYCINLIYYRSSLIMKWIVSVIPFLLLFVVFPYVETITQGAVSRFIGNFFSITLGFAGQTTNPLIAVMSFIIGYLIFGAISFLLIRRAVVKQ